MCCEKRSPQKKILENIQQVSYCTECLEDYLSYSLIPFGNTWKYLCWRCYRTALRQIRPGVIAKRDRDKNPSQSASDNKKPPIACVLWLRCFDAM